MGLYTAGSRMPCEVRDGGLSFYQGCNNIPPIPAFPLAMEWNQSSILNLTVPPASYNPNHVYEFYFNGGSSQAFLFFRNRMQVSWYGR